MKKQKQEFKDENAQLWQQIQEFNQDVEDILDLDDSGFAARRYPGLDSERLAGLFKRNRAGQKELAKNLLDECNARELTVGGSNTQGKA